MNTLIKLRNKMTILNSRMKEINNVATLHDDFMEVEYLLNQCRDDLDALLQMYHTVDVLDDEAIMDGLKGRFLVRQGDKIAFITDSETGSEVVSVFDVPPSVIGLTFDYINSKLEEDVTVVKFIQIVNGLMQEMKRYEFSKGVWLQYECRNKCL